MKNNLLLLAILPVFSLNCLAQNTPNTVTEKKKDHCVYVNVIKTYERIIEKGYRSADLYKKLGDAYYSNFELDKAERWYCELFAMTTNLEPKYYYQYAQSLKFIGQIDKANEILEKGKQKPGTIAEKTPLLTRVK